MQYSANSSTLLNWEERLGIWNVGSEVGIEKPKLDAIFIGHAKDLMVAEERQGRL